MANQLQHIRRDGVNGGNAIPEGLLKRLDCNGSQEESCAKVAEAVVELLV